MSTFLARKYFRNPAWVGRREKLLGIGFLLLIGGLVAGFALYASTNHDYLFDLPESALEETEVSRADFLAAELLPDVTLPGWKATTPAQPLPVTAVPTSFAELSSSLVAYGCGGLFHRVFKKTDAPAQAIAVLIADVTTPEQAFGLWHALRPEGAERITAGRGAWRAGDGKRAGFWSGHYYTEVRFPRVGNDHVPMRASGASPGTTPGGMDAKRGLAAKQESRPFDDKRTLSRFVLAMAANQLAYGGPFPARALLSDETAIPESFRYLHTAAFGIEPLARVFAMDRTDGVTVWLADAGSPASAQRLFTRIEKEASAGVSANRAKLRRRGAVTLWEKADGNLSFFTAERFVYGAWGADAKAVLAAANLRHDTWLSANRGSSLPAVATIAAGAESAFPEVDLEGWSTPRRVDHFTPATLFEKIDGRADAYLQFNVVGLNFGTYFRSAEGGQTVDVYDYDMGKPAGASGIFAAEASAGADPVDFGQAGYVVDGAVFFRKGSRYVQVLPSDPQDAKAARAIARAIAETIEAVAEVSWAERVLPAEGRVDGSLSYLAKDVFDLEFLTDVYTAEYDRAGRRVTLFVHRAASPEVAADLLRQYEASFADFGKVLWKAEERSMVAGDVGGVVDVVFAKGRYLAGVAGCDDAKAARAAAAAFYDAL